MLLRNYQEYQTFEGFYNMPNVKLATDLKVYIVQIIFLWRNLWKSIKSVPIKKLVFLSIQLAVFSAKAKVNY